MKRLCRLLVEPQSAITQLGRISRGNGWHAHLAADVRAATRSSDDPAVPSNSVSLRCAVSR